MKIASIRGLLAMRAAFCAALVSLAGCGENKSGGAANVTTDANSTAAANSPANAPEKVDMSLDEFIALYQKGPERVSEKYKGKQFELTGKATRIERSISSGEYRIRLGENIPFEFIKQRPWDWIVPEQEVTVRATWRTDAFGFGDAEIIAAGAENPGLVTTAENFAAEYNKEGSDADKYNFKKWIIVTGEVVELKPTETKLFVFLKGDDRSRIECEFMMFTDGEPEAKQIKIGDKITVVGLATGRHFDDQDIGIGDCHQRHDVSAK